MLVRPEVGYALAARGAQGATMLAAGLCVTRLFSLEEQGLFFVFLSFSALLQMADFGLAYAVLQTASHFKASDAMLRWGALRKQALALNRLFAAAAALAVGGLGALVLARGVGTTSWAAPWAAFVMAVLAGQRINLELVLIEGGPSAAAAWRLRLLQEAAGGCVFVALLLAGAGLWSLPAYWVARAWAAGAALAMGGRSFIPATAAISIDWRVEVWPFQWRIGLSALGGFLIFQAFNPIVLLEQGSAAAGRFGLSLAVMNLLLLVTTAWPLSQASHYGRLLSQGDFLSAQRSFARMLVSSTALSAMLAGASLLCLHAMLQAGLPLASRLGDLATTAALLTTGVVHHATACFAVMLRAERREPLLRLTVVGGCITVLVLWLAARHLSLRDIALASLLCTLVGLVSVLSHYRRFARRVLRGAVACRS